MKKIYSKPEVVFESFMVSTSIAAGCEVDTDQASRGNCGLKFGSYILFVSVETGCNFWNEKNPNESADGICYHNPSENNNLFNS